MYVSKISIGRGKKLSINYNSYDYHVSVTLDLEENDNVEKAQKLAISTLNILEKDEIQRIKEEIE